jgi:hypothetical protein
MARLTLIMKTDDWGEIKKKWGMVGTLKWRINKLKKEETKNEQRNELKEDTNMTE